MSALEDTLDLMASLRLEDGKRWGEVAVSCQWEDARAILNPDSTTPYHFLTRSRGFSKTVDNGGFALTALLTQFSAGSRSYAIAADREQARLLLDAIANFCRNTPVLSGHTEVEAYRVFSLANGASLEVMSADAAGVWGRRPVFVFADELAQWPDTNGARRVWEAMSSAVAKVRGSRLVVLTTAGDPAHWSRNVLDHALVDPLWRVHEVHGPAPWLDPRRVAEQRRRLPESTFCRLFLNEWTAAENRLTGLDDLRACVTLPGPLEPIPGVAYVCSLDVGIKRDRTVAAVCHAEREGSRTRVILDRMEMWAGTRAEPVRLSEVGEWLAGTCQRYRARLVLDPWQAIDLAQRLRARGVRVEEFAFSAAAVGRLASTLHLLLRDRAFDLPDDEALIDELANVRLRETSPGVLGMDHDSGRHDDRAIALALAAQHLLDAFDAPVSAAFGAQLGRLNGLMTSSQKPWSLRGSPFREWPR